MRLSRWGRKTVCVCMYVCVWVGGGWVRVQVGLLSFLCALYVCIYMCVWSVYGLGLYVCLFFFPGKHVHS